MQVEPLCRFSLLNKVTELALARDTADYRTETTRGRLAGCSRHSFVPCRCKERPHTFFIYASKKSHRMTMCAWQISGPMRIMCAPRSMTLSLGSIVRGRTIDQSLPPSLAFYGIRADPNAAVHDAELLSLIGKAEDPSSMQTHVSIYQSRLIW